MTRRLSRESAAGFVEDDRGELRWPTWPYEVLGPRESPASDALAALTASGSAFCKSAAPSLLPRRRGHRRGVVLLRPASIVVQLNASKVIMSDETPRESVTRALGSTRSAVTTSTASGIPRAQLRPGELSHLPRVRGVMVGDGWAHSRLAKSGRMPTEALAGAAQRAGQGHGT